jgi:ammonium transporter, Amt family
LYATALSRSKNAAGVAMRGLFEWCVTVLAFSAIGSAILFQQHNGWIGLRPSLVFLGGISSQTAPIVFFYVTVVPIAAGVLTGALAERSRFFPACLGSILLVAAIVPLAGKWAWSGWLHRVGFIDLAGASAIHISAGVCAAVGAIFVGPRGGKYHRDGSASMIPGHNVPLAGAGAMFILVAWVPYMLGFAVLGHAPLGIVALNVMLAGSAGGVAAVLLGRLRYGKPDITLSLLGLLGGLVAITAGAGRVSPPAAFAIGAIAGVLVPLASIIIDLIVRIDDPPGGISVHAIGGMWGTIAAGLFTPASIGLRVKQVGIQILGVIAIAALAAVLSTAVFYAVRATIGLRARDADEFDGLDLAEHDIGAYPDFQQTMIKSYHLREA